MLEFILDAPFRARQSRPTPQVRRTGVTYRIRLIHTVTETDDSEHSETVIDTPLTARGLAKVWRRWNEETAYIRRVFGPTVILPKHRFFARVLRNDGTIVTAKTRPVYEYGYDAHTDEPTERIIGREDEAIDPIEHISLDSPWADNAESILKLVRKWDARQRVAASQETQDHGDNGQVYFA